MHQRPTLVVVALVVIPVNLHVHHAVRRHQVIAAHATNTRLLLGVMRHLVAHLAANLLALKNAGMTIAANVTARKFAGKLDVSTTT